MIIKIKSHKSTVFKHILEYMLNAQDRLFDKHHKSFAITHNLKGNSIEEWVKQYKANELFRQRKRKDSVILTHEILSWHKDDAKNITLKKLEDLARQYIEKRNQKGMYVAVPHFDKEHYHVHICASGVEYKTGKSLRMAKAELQKLKKEVQEYQVEHYPELSKSIVAHGKKEKSVVTDKEYQYKLRTGRETHKSHLIGILKTCYKKASSRESFFELLKECNLQTYDRSGKTTGIMFNNLKFRFSRLGFTEERILDLDKSCYRKSELNKLRDKSKEKDMENDKADSVEVSRGIE